MDRQPILEGERLLLRPLTAEDREALFEVAADPLLWEQHPVNDRWRRDVFDSFFDEALREQGALLALLKGSGKVAGSSQFRPCSLDPGEAEIGWTFLARDHWGTGLNHEMKRLMVAHVLADYPRVLFRIGETNARSRKAMEAIGGELIEGLAEEGEYKGRNARHVVYAITREAFASGPLS